MDDPDLDTAAAGPAFAYVELGVTHGLSREVRMRAAGLDERLRADPDARVPMADLAATGVTGQILLRADDIAHAAALGERFSRLTDTALAPARSSRWWRPRRRAHLRDG